MRPRPLMHCFVARIGTGGLAFDIELIELEHVLDRLNQGWHMVGPDPHDEIDLDQWLREAQLMMPSGDDTDDV